MRFFLLLFSVMVYSFTWAQDRYTESVPAVGESGYYRIALSQEMIGVSSDHAFKGIRIKDQQDKELPYFVEEYPFLKNSIKYVDLKQLKSGTDSKNSFVVVENDDELESLYIQIKSLDVLGKQVQIRGSHDGKQFYLVKAKTDVSVFERQFSKNDEVFEVHFPKGNYRYYEIQLSNSQEQPMEIWSIKTIKSLPLPEPEWQLLPLGPLLQKDSIDNKSYIYFPEFKYQYVVGKLVFEVATPKKYFREGKWGRVDFVISSKEEAKVFTEGVKLVKGEVMVVENRNNEPLRLQQIKAYGRPVYLCVYLEQGQAVKIHLDANLTQLPLYDLVYFKNDIPKALQVLYPADFTAVPQQKENLPLRGERWYESKLLMWAVIVIVGLFLVWMCIRIAHDVQKKA